MTRPIRRRSLAALAGALLGLAAAQASVAATPESVLVMAKSLDDLITLDPAEAFEFSGVEAIANMYDRLFEANPDRPDRPRGALAESWTVSSDGRSYSFTLHAGRRFHGGNPVTAADAAFSIRRAVTLNKTPAFILTQFGLTPENVARRVRALDRRRFELTVDRPYAPSLVLNVLSAAVASVIDREEVLAHERDGDLGHHWLRTREAGSGPFRLRRWNPGESLVLEASAEHPHAPKAIRRVVIRDSREPATQRLLLKRGDIDIARNLGPDQIAALAGTPGLVTWSAPQTRLFYLAMNQANPVLAQPKVREAIRYLIDYRGMAAALLAGRAEVRQTFLPKGFPGAIDEAPYAFDPARARRLLAGAGFPDGFSVTVDVRSDPLSMLIAQAIQASLGEGGLRLAIIPAVGKQVLTKYRARRHDIYLGQWAPDYLDPHSNAAAFARNPDNRDEAVERTLAWRNGWEIPELTQLTDEAVLERDPARRAALYATLQRRVLADSPFVILFQERALIAARDSVKGFAVGLTSDQTLYRDVSK